MRIQDIDGYSVFINKYDVKYVEEVDPKTKTMGAVGIVVVFKDESELLFDIPKVSLDRFESLFTNGRWS